ncbi:MAG: S-adenosylmethionine decarboxylase [Candidatus Korarchaeum sp.]|nr:S-adenosylmethionine decarboxylase [Candidatus Korarchaeum sp.]
MKFDIKPKEVQIIAELYDVAEKEVLDSPEVMRKLLLDVATGTQEDAIHVHVHEFEPYGLSGFLMTGKGYVTIHTWPEHYYATVNIVSFSDTEWSWRVYKMIAGLLRPRQQNAVEVKSGLDFQ